jgi:23S rRNA pseudouridine1911/1915/1917 synthase
MSPRFSFVVPSDHAGTRLDRCLAALHGEWTRSRVARLIDDGRVTLNGAGVKPATVVRAGDALEVDEPAPQPLAMAAEDIPLSVLWEDPHLLVLDKPPGLVIHPAAGNPTGTLVNALLHHCDDLSGIGGVERPGIVHRLDKDTSGLMVVAKSDRAHLSLSLAFRRRTVEKSYLAVCYGCPRQREGVIEAAIGRHPSERQQMAVVTSGRPSRTLYRVEEELLATALVTCRPVTGRTHQIRVHLAHLGHALVGDPLYARRQWRNLPDPEAAAACRDFPRQALHAFRLAFTHPISGERLAFEATPPGDLAGLIALLRRRRSDLADNRGNRP